MSDADSFLTRWSKLKAGSRTSVTAPAPSVPVAPPPLESLNAESDLNLLLQPGVSPDLLREALRRAWRTDPAIREFVGIAEMQWDFNDPNAMPGFGDLAAPDPALEVVQFSKPSAAVLDEEASVAAQDLNPGRDGQLDPVWLSGSSLPPIPSPIPERPEPTAETAPGVAMADSRPRRHGSALPRPLS